MSCLNGSQDTMNLFSLKLNWTMSKNNTDNKRVLIGNLRQEDYHQLESIPGLIEKKNEFLAYSKTLFETSKRSNKQIKINRRGKKSENRKK